MELFDKVYGCYYQVVKHILKQADLNPVSRREVEELCRTYGFEESALALAPKLFGGSLPLLDENGGSRLKHLPPKLPLTSLQKSWLKALTADPRVALFFTESELREVRKELEGTEPLYRQEDFYYYDQYCDGDPYGSPDYVENFRQILRALEENRILLVAYEGKKGRLRRFETIPLKLQYSSRENKFRLLCLEKNRGQWTKRTVLNLGRMKSCHVSAETCSPAAQTTAPPKCQEPVLLGISGERNSLERCMLHFAHYEKRTEYDEEKEKWLCSIYYEREDETELLIDVLSFGPVVRVLGPEDFLRQVRERVKRQHQLFYEPVGDLGASPVFRKREFLKPT